jgi:hypothetical protein
MWCEGMNCADWIADVSEDVQLIEHLFYQGLPMAEKSVSPILTTAIKREYSVFTEGILPFP